MRENGSFHVHFVCLADLNECVVTQLEQDT